MAKLNHQAPDSLYPGSLIHFLADSYLGKCRGADCHGAVKKLTDVIQILIFVCSV